MGYFYNSIFLHIKKFCDYFFLALIPLTIIFLLPLNFEPGAECFNEWATARLLLDWQGFPNLSLSLGYVLYSSLLMSFLEYKNFIFIEYLITFTFFYGCLYFLLRHWLNQIISFLTTVTFILIFYQIEGHNLLIGIGFILIYFRQLLSNKYSLILPLNLLLACTFHQSFIFTLFGHYLVTFLNLVFLKNKKIKFKNVMYLNKKNYLKFLIISVLAIVYSLSILNPSLRKDNNHYMDEMPWAPMKIKSSLDAGIMQMGQADYNARRISIEDAKTQDWYFTNKTIFKNAENSIDAIFKAPEVFVENIGFNLRYLFILPNSFILKWHNKPLIIVSALITIVTFYMFLTNLYRKKEYVFLSSFFISMIGITVALLLTRTSNLRYNVSLFPFILTAALQGTYLINQSLSNKFTKISITNLFAILMITGSFLANFSNYDKFTLFNWSSIFSNKSGYIYNINSLKNLVRSKDILLVEDSNWVKAFFNIKFDRVYSMHWIPPFKNEDKIDFLKQNITQFWVKPSIKIVPSKVQSTNYYIRYKNYILPLIEYAKKENWEIIQINNFGVVYRKPIL